MTEAVVSTQSTGRTMLPKSAMDNFRCFIAAEGREQKEWWPSGSDMACHSYHFFKTDPRFTGEGSRGYCKHICDTNNCSTLFFTLSYAYLEPFSGRTM
eukprot:TRINITY_DN2288_c0_g1_i1.p1 TRINITY_DN2288_c0_g1~~TRINITY_DN2288_c0_g1_i1.p1  ORF type:complete len:115 (-),score=14.10 TRINITY_DN2288_c0_g1_i1:42-335(-)